MRSASLRTATLLFCGGLSIVSLSGCGSSPPTRYYRLSEIAPAKPPAQYNGTGVLPDRVRLDPVAIPAEVDRPELVVHESDNLVHISDGDRWVAPLDEQVRRVLSNDLVARLSSYRIADPNEPNTSDPRRILSVSIARLDANAACAVTLRASWTLGDHQRQLTGSEQIDIPAAAPCPAALPASLSQALAGLADRLASAIAAAP